MEVLQAINMVKFLSYINERPLLTCRQCDRKFRHYNNLQRHIRFAHDKEKETEEENDPEKTKTYNEDGEFKPHRW